MLGDPEKVDITYAAAAGDDDDLRVRLGLAHLGDGLNTFLFRHDDVGDDEVRLRAAEQSHTAPTVVGAHHLIAVILQELDDSLPHDGVVIDNQNLRHAGGTTTHREASGE